MQRELWWRQSEQDQTAVSAQQVPVLQETDQEVWKTILSHHTNTTNNTNNIITDNKTCFIRIFILLVMDLVVGLLQVVWWRNPAETEGRDQHRPDWGLQHPALQ